MSNNIEAKISSGAYMGDPVKIVFGKPLKIYVADKDVSDKVIRIVIDISARGWLVSLEFAELSTKYIGGIPK